MGGKILILCAFVAAAQCVPVNNIRLRFRVAARNLVDKDDIGTTDPYAQVFVTENDSKDEVKLGETSTFTDEENPDWGETFEYNYDPSKRPVPINLLIDFRLHIKIYDHDNVREDDKAGEAYVDLTEYVNKGQHSTENLSKKGYVIVKSVDAVAVTPGGGAVVSPQLNAPGAPVPSTQFVTPVKLRFKLSARNLPDKDNLGNTDPYIELYTIEGANKEVKFARSATLQGTLNPSWGEVFEYTFDPTRQQKWLFRIFDDDKGREDDKAGQAFVVVADYIAKGQRMTVDLSKGGTLTIEATAEAVTVPETARVPQQPPSSLTKLRFSLSAKGLDDKDLIGTSDPYVIVSYKQDGLKEESRIGKTLKMNDIENPSWSDVFDFNYDPSKNPQFHFLILDEDSNRRDDVLGDVYVNVADYVAKKSIYDVKLEKGTLYIQPVQ